MNSSKTVRTKLESEPKSRDVLFGFFEKRTPNPKNKFMVKTWFFTVKLFLANFFCCLGEFDELINRSYVLARKLCKKGPLLVPSEIELVRKSNFDLCGCYDLFNKLARQKFGLENAFYLKAFLILEIMWLCDFACHFSEECLYMSALLLTCAHAGKTFLRLVSKEVLCCVKGFQSVMRDNEKIFKRHKRYGNIYLKSKKDIVADLVCHGNRVPNSSPEILRSVPIESRTNFGSKMDNGGCGDIMANGKVCYKFHQNSASLLPLLREIKFLLSHENEYLISLKSIVIAPTMIGYSMERYPSSCANLVGCGKAMGMRAMRQILKGLKYLHENGFVHLDLKPTNVVYRAAGRLLKIRIIDFGSVTKVGDCDPRIGTINYTAPERYEWSFVNTCADIWAAGCILYYFIFGRSLFDRFVTKDVIAKFLTDHGDRFGNRIHTIRGTLNTVFVPEVFAQMITWEQLRMGAEELLNKYF